MKNERVGELILEKFSKLWNKAIKAKQQKGHPLLQPCLGSIGTVLNCQTSSFHDFPLNIYSASLGVCKVWLMKGCQNCRGGSLCGCVWFHILFTKNIIWADLNNEYEAVMSSLDFTPLTRREGHSPTRINKFSESPTWSNRLKSHRLLLDS